MVIHRVLVVDDHEQWRQHIASMLDSDPRWDLVGEASDGLDAVAKAQLLRPDLILLDITLPTLNGLEVARRVVASHPDAKVLFLSEHRSWDIVEAALATKARGYLIKSDVGGDLFSAMDAVVEGRRFISASVVEPTLRRTSRTSSDSIERRHEVVFHSDETALLDAYASFVGSALEAGHPAIFVAVPSRLQQLEQRLKARGLNSDCAIKEGRYIPLNVAEVLSTYVTDGRFDEDRFLGVATSVLMKAASATVGTHVRIAACGDGACTLWKENTLEATIRVEQLWDQLTKTYNLDVLCGYLLPVAGHDQDSEAFKRICAEHSFVHPG